MTVFARIGFASATLLTLCFGAGSANAFIASPSLATGALATPVAMCGYTCRNGGRYIPGPPGVCAARGLEWCGPRGGGGGGVGVVVPGVGGVGVGPGGVGVRVGPARRECRTITTRRPDGSVVTVRRCD